MEKISLNELNDIKGGINITGAFLTSFIRGINVFLDVGRSLGSAIRRAKDKTICPY